MDILSEKMEDRARTKIERALSFSGGSSDMNGLIMPKKMRTPRDQMSHRIIEKRRRDRMNNCLANLGQLIPVHYLKQGQGRIEKTEIIEMATQYITQMQAQVQALSSMERPCCQEKFLMGYKECRDEVMRFLVEMAGYEAADPFCLTLLKHLHKQSKKFVPDSATSVYQASSPLHGTAGDFNISQNAGEVGGRQTEQGSNDVHMMSSKSTVTTTQSWVSSVTGGGVTYGVSSPSAACISPGAAPRVNPGNKQQVFKEMSALLGSGNSNMQVMVPQGPLSCDSGYSTAQSGCRPVAQQIAPTATISHPPPQHGGSSSTSSPETTLPDNSSDSSGGNNGTTTTKTVYKFKNDIKHRFTSDNSNSGTSSREKMESETSTGEETSPPTRQQCETKQSSCSAELSPSSQDKISDYSKQSLADASDWSSNSSSIGPPSTKKSKMSTSSSNNTSGSSDSKNSIPAFALHPSGTFYIPLVVKQSIIEPFLPLQTSLIGPCHPVSIPVKFNRPEPLDIKLKDEDNNGQSKVEN